MGSKKIQKWYKCSKCSIDDTHPLTSVVTYMSLNSIRESDVSLQQIAIN